MLLESANRLGGAIESAKFKQADFAIELGAHSIYRSYKNTLNLIKDLNLNPISREIKFANDRHLKSFLGTLPLLSWPALLTLPFKLKKIQGQTAKDFLPQILGKRFYESVARPALRALLCQNPDAYPLEMFLSRKKNKTNNHPKISRPVEGMENLIDLVAADLVYKLNTKVVRLTADNNLKGYCLETNNGKSYPCSHIVFACGAKTAAELSAQLLNNSLNYIANQDTINNNYHIDAKNFKALESSFNSYGIFFKPSDKKIQTKDQLIINTNNQLYWSMLVWFNNQEIAGATIHTPIELEENLIQLILKNTLNLEKNQIKQIVKKENILPIMTYQTKEYFTKLEKSLPNTVSFIGNYVSKLSIEACVDKAINKFYQMFPTLQM